MTRAHSEAPPTWFRLSEESWAEIREAYRNGATARELAARWKVSPTSIYRHACEGGWTKKGSADAAARAHAEAIAAEEAADEAGVTEPSPDAVDATPTALRERALCDLARALAAGRYSEAQALGRLLETLGRLGAQDGSGGEEGEPVVQLVQPGTREGVEYLAQRIAEMRAEAIWPRMRRIAEMLVKEQAHVPMVFLRAALRWRAQALGPEVAAADRTHAARGPHYAALYDAEGRVREGWGVYTDDVEPPAGVEPFTADLKAARALVLEEDRDGED